MNKRYIEGMEKALQICHEYVWLTLQKQIDEGAKGNYLEMAISIEKLALNSMRKEGNDVIIEEYNYLKGETF